MLSMLRWRVGRSGHGVDGALWGVLSLHFVPRLMLFFLPCLLLLMGCGSGKRAGKRGDVAPPMMDAQPLEGRLTPVPIGGGNARMAAPPLVVYRMREPLENYVPVGLGASGGNTIVSYPAPSDVHEGQRPTPLTEGYWLDNRGVSPYSAFTRFTYGEYVALEGVTQEFLLKNIKCYAPFSAFYVCPLRGEGSRAEQAQYYVDHGFEGCECRTADVVPLREVEGPGR